MKSLAQLSAPTPPLSEYEIRNGFPEQPLRCHHLKAAGRAAAYARLALSGAEDDGEETWALSLGTTVHAIIQGRKDILVYRGAVRRGKEWEAFKEAHPGCRIVLDKEMKTAEAMAEALLRDKDACEYIKARAVKREKTILFDYLGRQCRATPDLCAANGAWVAELKTTRNADPQWFSRDAERLGYHVQLAMQGEALEATKGKRPEESVIIAVESSGAFLVTVMRVDEESLERGRRQMRLWVEKVLAAEKSGYWAGYAETIVPLTIGQGHVELDWGGEGDEAAE